MSTLGEMHVRQGRYVGIAPLPGGLVNVCLVKPWQASDATICRADELLRRELAEDPILRERFADARLVTTPVVLGPLAVDVSGPCIDGLLLAGDAAGFIDPMTGDGMRFAVRGGELAATRRSMRSHHGWDGVRVRIGQNRQREFRAKWRFNRALRALVASSRALHVAGAFARVAPSVFQQIVCRAGDCDLARAC